MMALELKAVLNDIIVSLITNMLPVPWRSQQPI